MLDDRTVLTDRYVLDREIGRGGMGSVWLGHDTLLDRVVAVKQIGLTSVGAAPDLARAEREAHLAARVSHQNVVAVFDLVEQDGRHWLVMEHVDGPTLAAMIVERGALDAEVMAAVLEQVAGALSASHELGIIHRDVKPSNILLTSAGRAKLSDFGVARAGADASLTQTGLVTGSPAYLAPEVATGRPASAASDVWSLGATAFHALAGRAPYEVGDHLLSTMYSIVNDEPPRLDGDGPLGSLVASMMQHDPDARPTMAQVQRALRGLPAVALDLDSTQAIAAVIPDGESAVAAAEETAAFVPLTAPVEPPRRHTRERDRSWLLAAGAAAAVLAVVAIGAVSGGGELTGLPGGDPSTAAASSTPTPSPDAETDATSPDAVLEGFAGDYLTEASNNPEAGYTLLTPDYQRESGGIEGYRSFWGKVSQLDIESIRGDAARSTVSYRYSYEYEGDRRTEDVTLRLEKSGDSYLIAGTA